MTPSRGPVDMLKRRLQGLVFVEEGILFVCVSILNLYLFLLLQTSWGIGWH